MHKKPDKISGVVQTLLEIEMNSSVCSIVDLYKYQRRVVFQLDLLDTKSITNMDKIKFNK